MLNLALFTHENLTVLIHTGCCRYQDQKGALMKNMAVSLHEEEI